MIKQSSLDEQEQMTLEQQENEEEINDEYRPTTNGSDTTTLPETNPENEDNLTTNGTSAAATAVSTSTAADAALPNWNQSISFIFQNNKSTSLKI